MINKTLYHSIETIKLKSFTWQPIDLFGFNWDSPSSESVSKYINYLVKMKEFIKSLPRNSEYNYSKKVFLEDYLDPLIQLINTGMYKLAEKKYELFYERYRFLYSSYQIIYNDYTQCKITDRVNTIIIESDAKYVEHVVYDSLMPTSSLSVDTKIFHNFPKSINIIHISPTQVVDEDPSIKLIYC